MLRLRPFRSPDAKEIINWTSEPKVINNAKQEHIASYLGITPSSLSRMKNNL